MMKLSALILMLFMFGQPGLAIAANPVLEVSPTKCVTLKQGSQCYQNIEVNWQTKMQGQYCLTLSSRETPLQCWVDSQKATYVFEFVGHESTLLGLVDQTTGKLLMESMIEVKWVYKNRSRYLSWRVF